MDDKRSRSLIIIIIIIIVIILVVVAVFTLVSKTSSPTSSTVTGCSPLPPPTGITVITIGLQNVQVSWLPVPDATGYRVYVGTISGFTVATSFNDYLTAETTLSITGLVLGRTYYIKVLSINACNNLGTLSPEVSVNLGYPPKFRIVSRAQPSLCLRVAPDFVNIIVDGFCSGEPGDDLCIWTYDPANEFITNIGDPNICILTFPQSIDIKVKYLSCTQSFYLNSNQARRWNYNIETGALCNPINVEGLNCMKIGGPVVPGQVVVRVPFDFTPEAQWDIVQAL